LVTQHILGPFSGTGNKRDEKSLLLCSLPLSGAGSRMQMVNELQCCKVTWKVICAIEEDKWEEEAKLSPFVDDMILYLKDPKNSTKKLLEIIYSFGKVAGYKNNIQKSVAFLYTNNEQTKKGIREIISFKIASKITKYLGINLMKETKVLYENYKKLKRGVKEDIRRWRDFPC
jgi:hypothetical protein